MSLAPEVRRGGGLPFGQVVSQWVCDDRYTTNLRTLYTILVTYADIGSRDTEKGKPYRAELARQLGTSLSTLDRTAFEGECAGLFRVEERKDPNNPTVNDANIYHLNDALFWRGDWVDPLRPGEKAADVAKRLTANRVAAKKAAGYVHKGGRKKKAEAPEEGVASPVKPPQEEGGSVMGDATPGVMGEATLASPMTPNVYSPAKNPDREPRNPSLPPSSSDPDARANAGTDGRTDGGEIEQQDQEQAGEPDAGAKAPTAPAAPVASAGMMLLLEIGVAMPELRVSVDALRDQGAALDRRLTAGWPVEFLRASVTTSPKNEPVRNADAVVAYRIALIPEAPGVLPGQDAPAPTVPAQSRAVVDHPCPGCPGRPACGYPVTVAGTLCPSCLTERTEREVAAWGLCAGADCQNRAAPEAPAGLCPTCAAKAARAALTQCSTEDCDSPAVLHGQCTRCRREDRERGQAVPPADNAEAESDAALARTIARFAHPTGATRPGGCVEGANGCSRDAVRDGRCEDCHDIWTGHQEYLDALAPAYAGQEAGQAPF
ncbi:hypothetical protein [Kitasatospora sp. NPDC006786]|uniref:hypothetical protein n=1 Tax=unclassified Kitasatospora TaxID=2633591 RepID=UPI0033E47C38